MDFPGRLIAGLIAVVLIILFPLQYIAGLNNENIDSLVDDRTHKFSDSIRQKGYLDKQMYEEYVDFLDTTGERYEITLQDIHPVKGEEYSHSGNREITKAATFERMSHNEIQSFATHTHTDACYAGHRHNTSCNNIPLTFRISTAYWSSYESRSITVNCGFCQKMILQIWWSKWSGEAARYYINIKGATYTYYEYTNEYYQAFSNYSQLSALLNPYINKTESKENEYDAYGYVSPENYIFKLPYVEHTGCADNNCSGKAHVFYVYGGYSSYWNEYQYEFKCNYCNNIIMTARYYYYQGTTYYRLTIYNKNGTVNTYYEDASLLWSFFSRLSARTDSDGYISENVILDEPFLNYSFLNSAKSHGCTYPTDACSLVEDEVPICDKVVTSITAAYPTQTVDKGKPIVTTATATCLNGHTITVTCTSNYNPNIVGTQTVTLTYSGLVGNAKTTGTRTCTVSVTVRETNVPSSLTVTASATTVYNGTKPTFTVVLTYTNGTTKTLTSDQYTESGWSSGVGNKTVIFSYTESGKTVTNSITITVVAWLISITVTPPSQEIQRYSGPIFTVRANFANGSSQIVTDYTVSGLDNTRLGTQTVTITYRHPNNEVKSATVGVTVTVMKKVCPRCKQLYELNTDDTDPGCPICRDLIIGMEVTPNSIEVSQGEPLPVNVKGIYNDGTKEEISGWTSNYNPSRIGLQLVTIQYRGYAAEITVWVHEGQTVCPICNNKYPISDGACPICSENVIRIEATPKSVIVMQYEPIPLTVTAYYADGSSREVSDWGINKNTMVPGKTDATVSYKGVNDTITLTVISINSILCPICNTIYELSDSPKGCPICSVEIIEIEAYLTSGTNLVQLGTTPSIAVIPIFRDGHREMVTEGYTLENYNSHELGVQTVRVLYKGFATTIVIEVVNILDGIICPNGHVYSKNSDGSDPGCPFCHGGEEISNIAYFDITYTTMILEAVYSIGVYHFDEGNYISVIVTKKDKSLLYKMQKTLFNTSMLGRKKRFIYGGEVY